MGQKEGRAWHSGQNSRLLGPGFKSRLGKTCCGFHLGIKMYEIDWQNLYVKFKQPLSSMVHLVFFKFKEDIKPLAPSRVQKSHTYYVNTVACCFLLLFDLILHEYRHLFQYKHSFYKTYCPPCPIVQTFVMPNNIFLVLAQFLFVSNVVINLFVEPKIAVLSLELTSHQLVI